MESDVSDEIKVLCFKEDGSKEEFGDNVADARSPHRASGRRRSDHAELYLGQSHTHEDRKEVSMLRLTHTVLSDKSRIEYKDV